MLMVIFGAGASYDSCPTYTPGMKVPVSQLPGRAQQRSEDGHDNDYYRPPLAKDLFANRPLFIEALQPFPQCNAIVPRLRAPEVLRGALSVETVLQEIEGEADTYERGKQELAAIRCYLQHAISRLETCWRIITKGVTNYGSLLREIERMHKGSDPVLLVTFNYDTLLEEALENHGRRFKSLENYTQETELFRVFKLHGSVNWGREVKTQLPASIDLGNRNAAGSVVPYMIEHAAKLTISDKFVLCHPSQMGVADGRAVFPAIAIPVEKKSTFECPQHMIEGLKAVLPQVTAIFVIGWRGTEEHFLDLLRQHLGRKVYVCIVAGEPKEAATIQDRIRQALVEQKPDINPEGGGFTEFMRTRRSEQILAHFLGRDQEWV